MNNDERRVAPPHQEQGETDQSLLRKATEMPLPRDPRTLLLLGIFLILMFFALYFISEIALPIILAVILYLLLQPSMRALSKLRLPKTIAALVMISMLMGGVTALGFTLSGPMAEWMAKAPEALPRLQKRLAFLTTPISKMQRMSEQVEKIGVSPAPDGRVVMVRGPTLGRFLVNSTQAILTGALTVVVLLFFLLVSGDLFLRRFLDILPTFKNKAQALDIFTEIEDHISGYLLTISMMNAGVGIATGFAAYFCGLADPVLWATVAFLMNFILILGPLACAGVLLIAGLMTFDTTWQSTLPAAIYLAIHFIEGEVVTPALLARRLTLNPVLIIVSLVFWYWMWGVLGALLAVPLLGTFKIVCDRIRPLMAIGHFLGTEART